MIEYKSDRGNWSIKYNELGIYALKLEGEGTLWLERPELHSLIEFLNSLDINSLDKNLEIE